MIMEIGRLVFDVEVKEVGENKRVLNNRLAIQNSKDDSTFVDIVAWNATADIIGKYFKKGNEILVQGHLINRTKKKDDTEYETVVILIDKIIFTHGNPKEKDTEDFL